MRSDSGKELGGYLQIRLWRHSLASRIVTNNIA